mmetsp:Transcript_13138/g.16716  ORF Transcript_13138/g.16716 Transcript_13138/m.16716 type:complete len:106 (+) Transcript_13138:308-625(+)|eukprot:CAMPEP_0170451446 /NCGR_PEP_ID=MMETSP0123-20130129/686_1 /TAXON_ID=182087 /ORGANISM="Favella ehrenbergii, Strain Fehren 1" /LENGTH=105 /DNA_ID=CAMNT_0010713143 /DNA_START=29 /DNA_END=346 /DNA_ORIENTATION=-
MVAAALSNYDGGKTKNITDPSIGRLKFVLKEWGEGIVGIQFRELKTRLCEREDFNFDELQDKRISKTKFYPIDKNMASDLRTYGPGTMECPQYVEDIKISGNFDT